MSYYQKWTEEIVDFAIYLKNEKRLNAPDIARKLSEKFEVPFTSQAVRSKLCKVNKRARGKPRRVTVVATTQPALVPVSEETFHKEYDDITRCRERMREFVVTLKEGWMYRDTDVRTEVGGNTSLFRQVSNEEEFKPYQLVVNNQRWWSTPETIERRIQSTSRARRV